MKAKKLLSLVLLIAVTISLAGCLTIKVGGKAELAPSTEKRAQRLLRRDAGMLSGDWFR